MSRTARLARGEHFLATMERDYVTTLRAELITCMNGHGGLFGTNDAAFERAGMRRLRSHGAADLLERGAEIEELRTYLGLEPYALHQRYLELRAIRHRNAPGEPKLARLLFAELPADGEPREAAPV